MFEPTVFTFDVLYLNKDKELCKDRLYHSFVPRKGDTILLHGGEYRVDAVLIDYDNKGEITPHLDYKFNV